MLRPDFLLGCPGQASSQAVQATCVMQPSSVIKARRHFIPTLAAHLPLKHPHIESGPFSSWILCFPTSVGHAAWAEARVAPGWLSGLLGSRTGAPTPAFPSAVPARPWPYLLLSHGQPMGWSSRWGLEEDRRWRNSREGTDAFSVGVFINKVQRTNSLLEARKTIFKCKWLWRHRSLLRSKPGRHGRAWELESVRDAGHTGILNKEAEETYLGRFRGLSMCKFTQAPQGHTLPHQTYTKGAIGIVSRIPRWRQAYDSSWRAGSCTTIM